MAKLKTTNPYDDEFFKPPTAPAETSQADPPSDPMVRLNVDVDRQLHRALKRLALDEDRTVADVVRSLITAAVSSHRGDHA